MPRMFKRQRFCQKEKNGLKPGRIANFSAIQLEFGHFLTLQIQLMNEMYYLLFQLYKNEYKHWFVIHS